MVSSGRLKALIGMLIADLFATIYTLFFIPGVLSYYAYLPFGYHFLASMFVLFGLAILLTIKGRRWGPVAGLVIGGIFIYGALVYPIGLQALPLGAILGIPTISISLLGLPKR